ncbi:ead/Ea22-like family protein [Kluyvera sichuanensis]|uniref:ead/Ea22-like family protein n=1 Tax=Kluyvera sichuanensis TaxID=2725494 RepID=UPI0034A215CE
MNDITALMATMKAAAEKATPGEWWSDVVETDGEYGEGEDRFSGYHSYAVYVGSESLLDMTNSTAACIHEEWDHDYHMAWDETAKRNAEFIAVASPDNVKTLVEALEKAQRHEQEWKSLCEAAAVDLDDWREIDDKSRGLVCKMADSIIALNERIAELESRTVTVKLPGPLMPAQHNSGELFMTPDNVIHGGYLNRDDVLRNLRAAGIQVIEGEQRNG